MPSDYGPEFDEFAKEVRENLVPKIQGSSVFLSITPSSPDKVDVQFAVQLGLAIMLDKPICAIVAPGTKIPEKLSRVVDRFVEMDFKNPASRADNLNETIAEMMEELKNKK